MMNGHNGHIMRTGAKINSTKRPWGVSYSGVLLRNGPSVCLSSTLHSELEMQSEVFIFRTCDWGLQSSYGGYSASSSQAEETNRIIYKCKIFIWDVSVAPLPEYNRWKIHFVPEC